MAYPARHDDKRTEILINAGPNIGSRAQPGKISSRVFQIGEQVNYLMAQKRFSDEDVCEVVCAHSIRGVEAEYKHGAAFEKCKGMMAAWVKYIQKHNEVACFGD